MSEKVSCKNIFQSLSKLSCSVSWVCVPVLQVSLSIKIQHQLCTRRYSANLRDTGSVRCNKKKYDACPEISYYTVRKTGQQIGFRTDSCNNIAHLWQGQELWRKESGS